jgi:hypothetical protein
MACKNTNQKSVNLLVSGQQHNSAYIDTTTENVRSDSIEEEEEEEQEQVYTKCTLYGEEQ